MVGGIVPKVYMFPETILQNVAFEHLQKSELIF